MRWILALIVALAVSTTADAQKIRGVPSGQIRGVQSGAVRGTPNYNQNLRIHNPYGLRDSDPYRYYWHRHRNHTDVVVVPNYYGGYQVYQRPVQQPDHWDRARADYFRQMYGPGGVYSNYR